MMREFNCVVCGKIAYTRCSNGRGKFCSKKCANAYARKARGIGKEVELQCMFNDRVQCGERNCQNCGWNPKVEQKRKEAFVYG